MEEYLIGLYLDDEDLGTMVCTMGIPVPDDCDPEEYIDVFLDELLSEDYYDGLCWDFI